MTQDRLKVNGGEGPIYVSYQEVKEDHITHEKITGSGRVGDVTEVIQGFDKQTGSYEVSEIDLAPNSEMFIRELLDSYPDIDERQREYLMNDFSSSLMTSARQSGKYTILIVRIGSVLVCHADSGARTITREGNVIERLLDTDNVDKYIEFRAEKENKTTVRYYERSQSKSIADWLGISRSEIAYRSGGAVRLFTEIHDETCSFEFTRDDFVDKFLEENSVYSLTRDGIFETPSVNYSVQQIQFAKKVFQDVDEFIQEFYTLYYNVHAYREQFNTIVSSAEPYEADLYDHRDRVSVGASGSARVRKSHNSFNISFASKQVQIHAGWATNLCKKFEEKSEIQLYHAGHPLKDESTSVGPFEFFNDIGIQETTAINELYSLIAAARMSSFCNLLCYILLRVAEKQAKAPVCHFFEQLAEKFSGRLEPDGLVINDETDVLEFKSCEWLNDKDEDEIADDLIAQTQGDVKLLIVGIEDNDPKFNPLSSSHFTGERSDRVKEKLRSRDGNLETVNIESVPLNGDECLLFVYVTRESRDFSLEPILA